MPKEIVRVAGRGPPFRGIKLPATYGHIINVTRYCIPATEESREGRSTSVAKRAKPADAIGSLHWRPWLSPRPPAAALLSR
jgi:hypothetical protein